MTKPILAVLAIAVFGLGGMYAFKEATNAPISVQKEIKVETVEVEVNSLQKRVSDAQEASKGDIEAKAKEAYDKAVSQALLEIELKVTADYRKEIEAKEAELKKQSISYWARRENVVSLIRETFPDDPHTAVAIAQCESGLNPQAKNIHNKDGTVDGGLWQINSVHDRRLQQLGLDKYNPKDATKFARMLYEQNGWTDWVCAKKLAMR